MISHRRTWFKILAVAVATAAVLHGCGGGGGSSSDDDGGNGGGGGGVSASGRIWVYDVLNERSETIAADGSEKVVVLNEESQSTPWSDGTQYLTYDYTGTGTDYLDVYKTSDGSSLLHVAMPDFSGDAQPSPVDKNVVSIKYYEDPLGEEGVFFVVNLETAEILHQSLDLTQRYKYSWLPDGRLLRIHDETGEIWTATVGGDWSASGSLTVPSNRKLLDFSVNHDGTKIAATFLDYEDYANDKRGTKSDLWVAGIDGSNQKRVTNGDITYRVFFAPDEDSLMFNMDTSDCGVDTTCTGHATWWFASASAQSIPALVDGSQNSAVSQVTFKNDSNNSVGLSSRFNVYGWTN